MNNNNYRYDISILRLFSLITVVLFHTYGMTYANHFSLVISNKYREVYEYINQGYLINIGMPMFITISGYLFCGQLINNRYTTFKHLFLHKLFRLIIPYYCFSILFILITKSHSWQQLYQCSYSHLWFLPMLFWCFVIVYLLKPIILNKRFSIHILILSLCFGMSLAGKILPAFLGLHNTTMWLYWFILGTILRKYDIEISKIFKHKKRIWLYILTIYIICSVVAYSEYGVFTWYGQIGSSASVVGLMWLTRLYFTKDNIFTNIIIKLSSLSFGVYILHYFLAPLIISRTSQHLFPISYYAENYIILFPLIFSIVTLILSFGLTKILRSTRIGIFLLK